MDKSISFDEIVGLSSREAAIRLKKYGYNELPTTNERGIFTIAFKILSEPMFLLLIAGGVLYFILGSIKESFILVIFVLVIMGITFYQEHKTERALQALRDLSSPRALVIREGREKRIAGREVALKDIVVVREGDYIPADAKLLLANNLSIDESLLTGESVPVTKIAANSANTSIPIGGDESPHIYASTLVVHGNGIAEVYATGTKTEIGKIGKALQSIKTENTPLQKMTSRLVRNFAIVGLSLCALVALIYGVTRGNYINGVLAGIALAMAILPEEIPVILTTFLALGAWRISRDQVLTRRVPAIEALGSASVLCVDKTGTLTMNEMQLKKIFADDNDDFFEISTLQKNGKNFPNGFHELMHYSILAGQLDPFDPMEKAIKKCGEKYLPSANLHFEEEWLLIQQYPLTKELLAITHVWNIANKKELVVAAKGAPEAIIDLCHLSKKQADKILEKVHIMANEGLRVLGVAKAAHDCALPKKQHDFAFKFLGLVGLADPVRPTVRDSIKKCYSAGVRVVMITGDYPQTAKNIAKQIGLTPYEKVITGAELTKMSNTRLQQLIQSVNVFARIIPEQKLRIVNALRANGEVVAMTGDGVNDAPALKAADIGIAMGQRGTDVAREASDLVLLDDDFSSIVQAVRLGRRIFDNIKKAMTYTIAVHIPIIGISLLPIILKLPLLLSPIHIVFLELIIDPACSIAFEAEPEERDVMRRSPRDPNEPLFSKKMLTTGLLQGVTALSIAVVVFLVANYLHRGEDKVRALTFTTLIASNLSLIFANRSWSRNVFTDFSAKNPALWWIISMALIFLSLVLYIPLLRNLFNFSSLAFIDIVICLSAGISSIFCLELFKLLIFKPFKKIGRRKNIRRI
jgi:P-type Ca2+ transporter type 2C